LGRFEYRYFNGVEWTSDVAVNGQRYVDAPINQLMAQAPKKRPPRGMAVASFITGASAVALGWVPFIFVLAVAAAIAALVFGILGLQNASRNEGYGRGFAVTGLVLAPVALVVCVGGFFFTRAVVASSATSSSPAARLVVDQPCSLENGRDRHRHDSQSRRPSTTTASSSTSTTTRPVEIVDGCGPRRDPARPHPGLVGRIRRGTVECSVTDVLGPPPFGIDQG
jgi:hypothetical protein